MKILFFTDVHIRKTNPISRIDNNFYNTILEKLTFISLKAQEIKPDITIIGGDLFDRYNPDEHIIIDTMKILKNFKNLYLVIGNHDIQGYSQISIKNSAIGILIESNIIKILDELIINNIRLKGMHCFSDEIFNDAKENFINILFAHKPITYLDIPNKLSITEINKVTNYNLIVSGDIHTGHFIKEKTIFINPNSVTRMSILEKNNEPKILILDITNSTIDIDFITIPHNKNIFIETQKEIKYNFDNFINQVLNIKINKDTLEEQIKSYIFKNSIDKEIAERIMKYYKKAMEEKWIQLT